MSYDIRIIDNVIRNEKGKPIFKQSSYNKKLYLIQIALNGRNTFFVERVKYYLHNSFQNNLIEVKRSSQNPNCSIKLWTWGIFTVKAKVVLKNGQVLILEHKLGFHRDISILQTT